MKNNIAKAVVIAIVIMYCVITLSICAKLYMKEVVVIDVCGNKILCEDSAGEIWSYYSEGRAKPGDAITLIMSTRGTTSIYDDAIIKIA